MDDKKIIKFLSKYLNGKREYRLAKKIWEGRGAEILDLEDRKLKIVIGDLRQNSRKKKGG